MYLSIIIPTYNEEKNVKKLAPLIDGNLPGLEYEIIFVDDNSPDGTGEALETLSGRYPVKVIHRKEKLGLSSAVVEGFKIANGSLFCIMDADLSHPAEKIKDMVDCLIKNNADIIVGSRLMKGSKVENWLVHRRFISFCGRFLTRPLTSVRDPLSGFFIIKKEVLNGIKIDPLGYKILLEILVKSKGRKVMEYPFIFKDRMYGKTKLDSKTIFEYLVQIKRLYYYRFITSAQK